MSGYIICLIIAANAAVVKKGRIAMEVKNLVPVNHAGKRVLSTNQVAEVFGTTPAQIRDNFRYAKKHFIAGRDYFKVEGEDLKSLKGALSDVLGTSGGVGNSHSVPFSKSANSVILYTEQGVARHCKMLNTPKAWEMFNVLVASYFNSVPPGPLPLPLEEEVTPDEEPILIDEKERTLKRMKKQLAKPCYELAVVYVLFMSNMTVKIGYTKDLPDRIRQIQAETGLEVFDFKTTPYMTREEAAALEATLKEKYAADCLGGEYFDVRFTDICKEL